MTPTGHSCPFLSNIEATLSTSLINYMLAFCLFILSCSFQPHKLHVIIFHGKCLFGCAIYLLCPHKHPHRILTLPCKLFSLATPPPTPRKVVLLALVLENVLGVAISEAPLSPISHHLLCFLFPCSQLVLQFCPLHSLLSVCKVTAGHGHLL